MVGDQCVTICADGDLGDEVGVLTVIVWGGVVGGEDVGFESLVQWSTGYSTWIRGGLVVGFRKAVQTPIEGVSHVVYPPPSAAIHNRHPPRFSDVQSPHPRSV